jgi:thiamine pyridinylase
MFFFPSIAKADVAPNSVFKVALFPYIPDSANDKYQELLSRIEREFESKNPNIDLVLRPLNPVDDDFYDFTTLQQWLRDSPSTNGYHLIEIDALLLDNLVQAKLIKKWKNATNIDDWHPSGLSAVTINDHLYGIPHLLCGHFIFSRYDSVVQARSADELIAALDTINPDIPNLAGDLNGSWNLPSLYLDSWADTHGPDDVDSAISPNLDDTAMKSFKAISQQCKVGNINPCFDEYRDPDLGAQVFVDGQVDAFLGYSERLNYIFKNGVIPEVKLTSAPLGLATQPLLFVDAFVLRQDCDQQCNKAAKKFVDYINAPETHEWVLMSQDAKEKAVPRYLLPATYSAFKTPSLQQDPYYQALELEIKPGVAYPHAGLPEVRKAMRDHLLQELLK